MNLEVNHVAPPPATTVLKISGKGAKRRKMAAPVSQKFLFSDTGFSSCLTRWTLAFINCIRHNMTSLLLLSLWSSIIVLSLKTKPSANSSCYLHQPVVVCRSMIHVWNYISPPYQTQFTHYYNITVLFPLLTLSRTSSPLKLKFLCVHADVYGSFSPIILLWSPSSSLCKLLPNALMEVFKYAAEMRT